MCLMHKYFFSLLQPRKFISAPHFHHIGEVSSGVTNIQVSHPLDSHFRSQLPSQFRSKLLSHFLSGRLFLTLKVRAAPDSSFPSFLKGQ